jgi:ArsR family transcriptional regulator
MKETSLTPVPSAAAPCCAVLPAPRVRGLDKLTGLYAALADPTRLRILALLKDGEVCVCHIHDSLGVPQPTASRHLAYLRRTGLVAARRDGIWMHYRVVPPVDPVLAAVFDAALHALSHADQTGRDQVKLQRELAAVR